MNVLVTKYNLTARVIIYFNTQTVYPEMLGGWCAKYDVVHRLYNIIWTATQFLVSQIVMPHNTTPMDMK